MNYATKYYIGNHQTIAGKTAKTVVPTIGGVCQLDAKTQRRKRNSERQTAICTNGNVANGFLKTCFLPKLKETKTVQSCRKDTETERDFYQSLFQLGGYYGIEPMQTNQFEYPYNFALAIWDMEERLGRWVPNWGELRLVQDSKKTYFISEEKYDAGTTLYYVPVQPIYQMLHDPKRKKNAQLLISVCSYLYQIVDVPYFRQENSYLFWMYEMHKDWVEQDEETEETDVYRRDFLKAELIGDCIEQRIFNRINLTVFEQRLIAFRSRDFFDEECLRMACNAFALFTEYPNASIFRNAPTPEHDPDTDNYDNGSIGMEKYISFVANTRGWLYECLSDSINNEFNEYGAMEEPTISKCFDGNDVTEANLDFESRLFTLLDDLCSLLYNYETTRK